MAHDSDSPNFSVQIGPKEVVYSRSLGRGSEVVKVLFHTITPRFVCYYIEGEKREPLTLPFEDIQWFVSDAKARYPHT